MNMQVNVQKAVKGGGLMRSPPRESHATMSGALAPVCAAIVFLCLYSHRLAVALSSFGPRQYPVVHRYYTSLYLLHRPVVCDSCRTLIRPQKVETYRGQEGQQCVVFVIRCHSYTENAYSIVPFAMAVSAPYRQYVVINMMHKCNLRSELCILFRAVL